MQNQHYWDNFYNNNKLVHMPSKFAEWCLTHWIAKNAYVLDLGCGNGRDSFLFLLHEIQTLGIDGSSAAIHLNQQKLFEDKLTHCGEFQTLEFENIKLLSQIYSHTSSKINTIYSRFVLHAITAETADRVIHFLWEFLKPGDRICFEFRTTNDPLFQSGEKLSQFETYTDHYRRFINAEVFRQQMAEIGWVEQYFIESNGLAVFGEQDPVVCRYIADKP